MVETLDEFVTRLQEPGTFYEKSGRAYYKKSDGKAIVVFEKKGSTISESFRSVLRDSFNLDKKLKPFPHNNEMVKLFKDFIEKKPTLTTSEFINSLPSYYKIAIKANSKIPTSK